MRKEEGTVRIYHFLGYDGRSHHLSARGDDNEIYNDGYYWILRFMIDEKYQGKCYAKLAIKEVIHKLKERTDCKQIRVSHVPYNMVANALYKKSGFQETDEFEDNGDIILSYYFS